MTPFRVDLAALETLIARLRAFEDRSATVVAEIESSVARLHADWSGGAAAEHEVAQQQWAQGAQRMRSAAAALRAVVATAHGNYAASSSANTRMWG